MARIPEEDITRIKRDTDLAALVRSRGIALEENTAAATWPGRVPSTRDAEPSFIVTPAKGLYHCMGCGAAGNAIQFVEKFDGVSFRHAFELLNDGPAAFTEPPQRPNKQSTVSRLDVPFDPEGGDADLFASVIDYYHERLLKTPAALDYLTSRGLHDPEMIKRFRLGFADRTLGLRLPDKNRRAGEAIRSRLQKLGLLRPSGHEHFNGSLVVPVFDREGHVSEIYGRKINNNQSKGYPLHLYLPGPHAGIWNAPDAFASGDLILCEAPLDALTFWTHGCEPHGQLQNVSFIYGTEGFPDYFMDAFIQHKVHTVRLAYDNDPAGNRAAERDTERLAAHGHQRLPHPVPSRHGRQRIRLKSYPCRKIFSHRRQKCGMAGRPHDRARSSSELVATKLVATCPEPPIPPDPVHPVKTSGEYHTLELGSRSYRIGGLDKNNSLEVMKISLRLRHKEDFHLDSLDLLRDGDRRRFIERAAEETGLEKELIKRDLGKLLLALEAAQDERINALTNVDRTPTVELNEGEQADATGLLAVARSH